MPLSPHQLSGISMGTQALGGIGSIIGQAIGAKKQRQHEKAMYERQKADNLNFWNMENQYNSPEMQMQRLKQAGLNPNLVYGNGATATGGTINSPEMKVSDQAGNMSGIIQQFGGTAGNMVNQIYDLRLKDAQANLLNQKNITEQTVQLYNAARNGLTEILQQSEQLKLALGQRTFNELVRQSVNTTQKMQWDILNTQQDTRLKTVNTDLGGQKVKETKMTNELLELEKNLYKGTLGIPSQGIEQIIKTFMLIMRGFKR